MIPIDDKGNDNELYIRGREVNGGKNTKGEVIAGRFGGKKKKKVEGGKGSGDRGMEWWLGMSGAGWREGEGKGGG